RMVRAERRRRHLTAEELGRKIGKGKTFVHDLEQGSTDLVTGETLAKIARALRLDPEVLLEAQRAEIRELRRSLGRLERAHTERTLGELELEAGPGVRRGLPLVEAEDGGLPHRFDGSAPEGRVLDYLYLPRLRVHNGFAAVWKGDDMEGPGEPSFRSGEVLVFSADREARHRDFVLAVSQGRSLFRQLFLDPKGRVRLQPLNLDAPPLTLPREELEHLFPLAARLVTY
ncbi:MAG: LexA family transcriptional regulator, partial [Planctomycetota bacterium]